jgi:hypothetical protein
MTKTPSYAEHNAADMPHQTSLLIDYPDRAKPANHYTSRTDQRTWQGYKLRRHADRWARITLAVVTYGAMLALAFVLTHQWLQK